MGEWKRVFNKKMLLLILSVLLMNLILFVYAQLSGRTLSDTIFANKEYARLIERYQGMDLNEALDQSNKEYYAIMHYIKSLKQEDITTELYNQSLNRTMNNNTYDDEGSKEIVSYYQTLSDKQKTQMELSFKSVIAKMKYLNGYHEDVKQVVANATTLKRYSIFAKPDSFSYNNIIKTGKDFERVQEVYPTLNNDKAADAFFHYYYLYYISFALMLVIIYSLFGERENGIWSLVHSTAYGRFRLALRRLYLIGSSSLIITAIFYISTVVLSYIIYGGVSDLHSPIQTLTDFNKFTYTLSKLRYLLYNFILSWFAIFVVSVVFWMLFTIFRNRNNTLILTGTFIGAEILLYNKIEVQSVFNALHYINIINLFRINETYRGYNNWGFGTHVFSVLNIIFLTLIILGIIAGIIAIMRYTYMKPESRQTLLGKLFSIFHQTYQKLFTHFPITVKETHKLIISGKGLWVIAAVIIVAIYFSGSGKMSFTDGQLENDKMYLEHGGNEYSYIVNYVNDQNQKYKEAYEKFVEDSQKYQNGEIDMKTFMNSYYNFDYIKSQIKSVEEYEKKIDYLQNIKDNYGITGYLISDRGYEEIFGQYSRQRELILIIVLVVGIMLIISECIALEYRTGMEDIVRSCEKGRVWVFRRKTAACIIFTGCLFLIVYGIDFWNLYHIYGMPYLDAPLMSLTFMEGSRWHVSILSWLFILLGIRLIICLITMVIAIVISKLMGKKGNRAIMPLFLAGIIGVIVVLHGMGDVI